MQRDDGMPRWVGGNDDDYDPHYLTLFSCQMQPCPASGGLCLSRCIRSPVWFVVSATSMAEKCSCRILVLGLRYNVVHVKHCEVQQHHMLESTC